MVHASKRQQKDRSDHLDKELTPVDSQLDHDGAGFDLVHFHEGETLCAGEPLLGFVVLEFKEDSCSWRDE